MSRRAPQCRPNGWIASILAGDYEKSMRRPVPALLAVALSLVAVPAFAQYDAYVKIDGVPGESQDSTHKNWISVTSFTMDVTRPASGAQATSGRAVARPNFSSIHVTKLLDKSTPVLHEASATGKHFNTVVLEGSKDKEHAVVWRITMQDAIVTGFHASSNAGDPAPKETVDFSYGKIEWEYRTQNPDGKLGQWVKRDVAELEKGLPIPVVRMRETELRR